MNIKIISVGKIKEKYLVSAIQEYSKRLSRYCKLDIVEVADEKTPDQASPAEEEKIKEKEAERILKNYREGSYLFVLAIEGKQFTSEEFAESIRMLGVNGSSDVTFIIGGSLGLCDAVIKKADSLLSFSKMTFPHQLMRVILLEQIYRAFRIIQGEPYHK